MVKSLKRIEKALRIFIRGKFAPKETFKYREYGAEDSAKEARRFAESVERKADAAARIRALKNLNEPEGSDGKHKPSSTGKIYIQIGAGAGDQDSRADFRDGFTEYVKKLSPESVSRIILVEPNPLNIPALKRCWENYPQAEIYQYGIVPKPFSGINLCFYYFPLDAPHYQVASVNAHHVLKHYKKAKMADLKVLPVATIDLDLFMKLAVGNDQVELLCLDIEGIDAEVLLDTDLLHINVNSISFEHIHLGAKKELVASHFEKAGFVKIGAGIDYNNYDWLYGRLAAGTG